VAPNLPQPFHVAQGDKGREKMCYNLHFCWSGGTTEKEGTGGTPAKGGKKEGENDSCGLPFYVITEAGGGGEKRGGGGTPQEEMSPNFKPSILSQGGGGKICRKNHTHPYSCGEHPVTPKKGGGGNIDSLPLHPFFFLIVRRIDTRRKGGYPSPSLYSGRGKRYE